MKKMLILAAVAALSSAPATAAGNGDNALVGNCISDGFYGNEPNPSSVDSNLDIGPAEMEPGTQAGVVLPTGSPGPWLYNGGDPIRGGSVGDYARDGFNPGILVELGFCPFQ